jgi:predicted site-specific integrase-resolvase
MLIGYARVSTDDQKLNLQQDALQKAGCEEIFEDYLSGAKASRPGLDSALKTARSGDTLVQAEPKYLYHIEEIIYMDGRSHAKTSAPTDKP